ncbi:hypothetical protein BpHYR1_020688 [Brachionus plicatilis]|uniref:Uncharacterized protein n=1 Tax=Brachionus plicatilis TaxID=10195 RepID=A0A3M7T534_BRAPC|nr:hypothetical protein BpHYR1_020688 [Brachionus plicatilis]
MHSRISLDIFLSFKGTFFKKANESKNNFSANLYSLDLTGKFMINTFTEYFKCLARFSAQLIKHTNIIGVQHYLCLFVISISLNGLFQQFTTCDQTIYTFVAYGVKNSQINAASLDFVSHTL